MQNTGGSKPKFIDDMFTSELKSVLFQHELSNRELRSKGNKLVTFLLIIYTNSRIEAEIITLSRICPSGRRSFCAHISGLRMFWVRVIGYQGGGGVQCAHVIS